MADAAQINAFSWVVARCERFVARVDAGFATLERRMGATGAAIVAALVLLLVAAVVCAPARHLVNHGIYYGDFARDPFGQSLTSPIRLRPLAPVIAHFMFLRGEAFMAFPLLAAVAFLALIIRTCRKKGFSAAEATSVAALMAFTTPILFTLHFAGYVDTVSYLFIMIAIAGVASDAVVAASICLALLNHDANVFILPWLVFHAGRKRAGWKRRVRLGAAVAVALVVVAVVRHAIAQRAPVAWNPGFYLNVAYLRENALLNVRGAWLGLFMVFKLCWLIPLVAVVDLAVKRRRVELLDLGLAIAGGLGTMAITSDASRLPALAFPAILGGAAVLRQDLGAPPRFARLLWMLTFVNLLVPQYYVGQSKPIVFYPLPVALGLKACGYDPWDDWLGLRTMHFSQE